MTQELPDLIEHIFRTVNGNFLSVDCTIMGAPVYEILSERLNIKILDEKGKLIRIDKRVLWCAFNEDIVTGFVKDDKDRTVRDAKGNVIEKKENALIFAVRRLNELFYDKKFDIPDDDYKFDNQFSSYVSTISGNRIIYGSTTEDHYVQSFEVFAILEWLSEQLPVLSAGTKHKKLSFGVS